MITFSKKDFYDNNCHQHFYEINIVFFICTVITLIAAMLKKFDLKYHNGVFYFVLLVLIYFSVLAFSDMLSVFDNEKCKRYILNNGYHYLFFVLLVLYSLPFLCAPVGLYFIAAERSGKLHMLFYRFSECEHYLISFSIGVSLIPILDHSTIISNNNVIIIIWQLNVGWFVFSILSTVQRIKFLFIRFRHLEDDKYYLRFIPVIGGIACGVGQFIEYMMINSNENDENYKILKDKYPSLLSALRMESIIVLIPIIMHFVIFVFNIRSFTVK